MKYQEFKKAINKPYFTSFDFLLKNRKRLFWTILGKINGQEDIEELRINYGEFKRQINREKMNAYLSEVKIKKLTENINILFELC